MVGTFSHVVTRSIQAPNAAWQHDMYPAVAATGGGSGGRVSAIETGTKLYISNLDFGVSNDDIKVYASPASEHLIVHKIRS